MRESHYARGNAKFLAGAEVGADNVNATVDSAYVVSEHTPPYTTSALYVADNCDLLFLKVIGLKLLSMDLAIVVVVAARGPGESLGAGKARGV